MVRDKTTRNSNFWPKAIRGEATREEWRHFVRDERLSAGVDFPTALFWRDLLDIYPNAKVVLFHPSVQGVGPCHLNCQPTLHSVLIHKNGEVVLNLHYRVSP